MTISVAGPHSYADLVALPEDNVRREVINGYLIVSPSPILRHQDVVMNITGRLFFYKHAHGGVVYGTSVDTFIDDKNVVQPDVIFITAGRMGGRGTAKLEIPPDLAVEVSSPSTRRRDLGVKRELYERFGVAEYWFVDLNPGTVEVFRLGPGGYGPGVVFGMEDIIESGALPGFRIPVSEVFQA